MKLEMSRSWRYSSAPSDNLLSTTYEQNKIYQYVSETVIRIRGISEPFLKKTGLRYRAFSEIDHF